MLRNERLTKFWYSTLFLFIHLFVEYLCSGTKKAAHRLKILFGLAGMKAAELHGNLTQTQRLEVSIIWLLYTYVYLFLVPMRFFNIENTGLVYDNLRIYQGHF